MQTLVLSHSTSPSHTDDILITRTTTRSPQNSIGYGIIYVTITTIRSPRDGIRSCFTVGQAGQVVARRCLSRCCDVNPRFTEQKSHGIGFIDGTGVEDSSVSLVAVSAVGLQIKP